MDLQTSNSSLTLNSNGTSVKVKDGITSYYQYKNEDSTLSYFSIPIVLGNKFTLAFTRLPGQTISGSLFNLNSFQKIRMAVGSAQDYIDFYDTVQGGGPVIASWKIYDYSNTHRYVIVRDGATINMYVDGVVQTPVTISDSIVFTYDKFSTANNPVYGRYISLDEIVITSDAKDQTWIDADYNGGLGRVTTIDNTPNAQYIWHFDEGTGTTATDSIAGNVISNMDNWAVSTWANIPAEYNSLSFNSLKLTNNNPNLVSETGNYILNTSDNEIVL